MIAATSPRVLERDDPWRWSSSPMLRARASGVWRFSASGVGGHNFVCFSGPPRETPVHLLLAVTFASTSSPWTLSRRPSPFTTKRPAKVARRSSVRAFAGQHRSRVSRVPRHVSLARLEDPLTPSRLPRSRLAGSLIPDQLFTPAPGLWFTNQGYEVRRSTHASVCAPTRSSSDEMSPLRSDHPTTSTVRLGMTKRY